MPLHSIFSASLETRTELCDHHYSCYPDEEIEAKLWRKVSKTAEMITCKNLSGKQFGNISNMPPTEHIFLDSKSINKNSPYEIIKSIYVCITALVINAKTEK